MDRHHLAERARAERIRRAARALPCYGGVTERSQAHAGLAGGDYELCEFCARMMRWTAAQPVSVGEGDALACDDCVAKGAWLAVAG